MALEACHCAISLLDGGLRFEGELRFDGIVTALRAARALAGDSVPAFADLGGVTDCDSSAVALMLELRRQGVREIRNMPAEMRAIVNACQLEGLLGDSKSDCESGCFETR
ncbi:MAG: STAS domain-containing protein [Pseudomonadota bacterium]